MAAMHLLALARAGIAALLLVAPLALAMPVAAMAQPQAADITVGRPAPIDQPALEQLLADVDALVLQGKPEDAEALIDWALPQWSSAQGADNPMVAGLQTSKFMLLSRRAAYSDVVALGDVLLPRIEAAMPPEDPLLYQLFAIQGEALTAIGDTKRAIEWLTRAHQGVLGIGGAESPLELAGRISLATAYQSDGQNDEAARRWGELAEVYARLSGPLSPEVISLETNRAQALLGANRADEAETLLKQLQSGLAEASQAHSDQDALVSFSLGVLYLQTNRISELEPLLRPQFEYFEQSEGDTPRVALLRLMLGMGKVNSGATNEGLAMVTTAVERLETARDEFAPILTVALPQLALALSTQERYDEAIAIIDRATSESVALFGPEGEQTLMVRNIEGMILSSAGRKQEAEEVFARNAASFERRFGKAHLQTVLAKFNIAALQAERGENKRAISALREIMEIARNVPGEFGYIGIASATMLGAFDVDRGDYVAAEATLEVAAERTARLLGADHPSNIGALVPLAAVQLRLPGRETDSLATARQAASLARRAWQGGQETESAAARAGLAGQSGSGRAEATFSFAFRMLAEADFAMSALEPEKRTSYVDEAFAALQDSIGGSGANRAIAQMAARRFAEQAGTGLGEIIRRREQVLERWRAIDTSISDTFAGQAPADPAAREALRSERKTVIAQLDTIDASLKSEYPGFFALIQPQAVTMAELQASLGPDEALLLTIPGEFGTQLIAVTNDGFDWIRSDVTEGELLFAVTKLRYDLGASVEADPQLLDQWGSIDPPGGPFSFDRTIAHAIYGAIVAPVAMRLAGRRQLFIVAGGSLANLPFSVLVSAPPEGADNDPAALRATHWLADDFALAHLPSVQSLLLLRRASETRSTRPGGRISFAGFGDPVLEGAAMTRGSQRGTRAPGAGRILSQTGARSGGFADLGELRALARLPGTAIELENMRVALHAPANAIRTGRAATEAAVRNADLSAVDILAFATHGLTATESGGLAEPGLVLTPPDTPGPTDDGYLTASEVTGLRLDADWIILSACNTASGEGSEAGGGISGLAQAFFYAGARNLLASHWPVNDDVAARITVRTIEIGEENPGLSRADAFQRAMREIREAAEHDSATSSWAHPAFWAPFILIGDGAD